MPEAPRAPGDEHRRLAALDRYDILDTPAEPGFDDIALLASRICAAPIALVSFVAAGRQWFKARVGIEATQTPLSDSVCANALRQPGLLVIPDLVSDPRTSGNRLVIGPPHIRFYAGARLETPEGLVLGTLCVIDTAPRPHGLTPDQAGSLEALARQVMALLALRRSHAELLALNVSLETQVATRTAERGRTWEVSPDLIGILNRDAVFETSNPAWLTVLGYAQTEIASRPFFEFLHPDDVAVSRRAWASALDGQPALNFENRYRHKDGRTVWLSWVAVPEDGKVYCRARDVTAEKAQAAELAARTRERDRLWETTNDLMGTAGFDGILKSVNPAWTDMLGWTEAELLGRPFIEFVDPAGHRAVHDIIQRLLAGETVTDFVDRLQAKPGGLRTIMWTAVPEPGADFAYIVGRDITLQREAEEAMRQSQKLEAIGQLTGGVAHDFNNLLTVIRSSSDLLKRPDLPEARRRRYIDAISDTVDRAARLTGQLLAFARRQALRPEVFDVNENVRAVADMLATLTGERIRIDIRTAGAPCFVDADASQFDTALVNMTVNARDAMQGEGRFSIVVADVDRIPATRAHPHQPGDYIAVTLSDTGSGMSEAQTARIFEPFYTTKEVGQGTGLGLSQVFGFSKQSGGDITVSSVPGGGTTFTLYLPRASRPPRAPPEPTQSLGAPAGDGLCVLVVEDNTEVGRLSTRTLEELGYRTHWVTDAATALTRLAAGAGAFDIVFSDVVMPGMNGVEFARLVRDRWPGLPVVLTSGYSEALVQDTSRPFPLLQKPYSVDALSGLLQSVVRPRP